MFRLRSFWLAGMLMLAACGNVPVSSDTAGTATSSAETAATPASAATATESESSAQAAPPAPSASTAASSTAEGALTPVTVSMGYIPDVQFAMYYVAAARGFYADEGLDVTFNHGFVNDALVQIAQGRIDFGNASGDEILLARSQQLPIKLVFQTYQAYPVAIFSKQRAGITQPADLVGKTVGVPGRFGATYVGLRGVLYAAKISEDQINIAEIGFTQAEAVRSDNVPAAVGYFNNEPLVLEQEGVPVNVMQVSDYINLVSNGIVASDERVANDPELVRRFVRATARGLQATLEDPDAAFEAALAYIPELPEERQPQERAKLERTLDLWHSTATDANGLGYSDPAAWATTHQFLRDSGLLPSDVDVDQAYTNKLRQ